MQTTIEKKSIVTSIIFIVFIAVITLFIIAFTVYASDCSPFNIDSFEEIKEVSIDDYKEQDEAEYFVFVYNTESDKHAELVEMVLEFANENRFFWSKKQIYILNYNMNKDIISKDHMNITNTETSIKNNIPALLLIKDGKISETKTTVSTIKTALYNNMDK